MMSSSTQTPSIPEPAPGVLAAKKPKVVPWRPSTEATQKAPSLGFYAQRTAFDREAIPAGQRKTFMQLTEKTCRWPVGDVGSPDFFFCGGEALSGPYCAHHHRMSRAPRGSYRT